MIFLDCPRLDIIYICLFCGEATMRPDMSRMTVLLLLAAVAVIAVSTGSGISPPAMCKSTAPVTSVDVSPSHPQYWLRPV